MVVLAVVLIILGFILIGVSVGCLIESYDGAEAFAAVLGIILGAAISFGGFALGDSYSNYKDKEKESINYCAEKGGIVNADGLCLVDGKPIKFENGEWTNT